MVVTEEFSKLTYNEILTMIVALEIRNAMEDFHCKYLSDAQMKELNPIIRKAIIRALVRTDESERRYKAKKRDKDIKDIVLGLHEMAIISIPYYWERPSEKNEYHLLFVTEKVLNKQSPFNPVYRILDKKECDICDTVKDSTRRVPNHEDYPDGRYCTDCVPDMK
jgi:hypothetical protein